MNGEIMGRILKSAFSGDRDTLVSAARQLALSERKQGHVRTAASLESIIAKSAEKPGGWRPAEAFTSPSPRSKMEGTSLIQTLKPRQSLKDIVLAPEASVAISRFLQEHAKQDLLSKHGLSAKKKVLLFGPPGNGKTLCAEVIATELGLPLHHVRLDSIIASYLGETASNLRKVFDYGTSHVGVLFFDEFDAIGKTRDDGSDVGELKRVVNSFLQMLDAYDGEGPLLAATNYEKVLDYGLWRRFDDVIFFPKATHDQLIDYFTHHLSGIRLKTLKPEDAARWCEGCSFSDANRILTEALKTMVIEGRTQLSPDDLRAAVHHYKRAGTPSS